MSTSSPESTLGLGLGLGLGLRLRLGSQESTAARIADCFMQTAPVQGALMQPIKEVALSDVSLAPAPDLVIRPSPAVS